MQLLFLRHDVVFLGETWLYPDAGLPPLPPCLASEFSVHLCNRPWVTNHLGRNSGGVAVLVRKQCPLHGSVVWSAAPEAGVLWGHVAGGFRGRDLHLIGCYFSPQSSNSIYQRFDLPDPFVALNSMLAARVGVGDLVLLLGDFNARMGVDLDTDVPDSSLSPFLACLAPSAAASPIPPRTSCDTATNDFGRSLAALAQVHGLCALNGRCPGDNTGPTFVSRSRTRRVGSSTVDWALASTHFLAPPTPLQLDVCPPLGSSPHSPLSLCVTLASPPSPSCFDAAGDLADWVWNLVDGCPPAPPLRRPLIWSSRVRDRSSELLQSPPFQARLDAVLSSGAAGAAGADLHRILVDAVQQAQPPPRHTSLPSPPQDAPYFTAEFRRVRQSLHRALRLDPESPSTTALQRSYRSSLRHCKRRWHRARVTELKRDLILHPRRFWRQAIPRAPKNTIGGLGDWHQYLTSLLGTQGGVSLARHGGPVRPQVPASNKLSQPFTLEEVASALKALKGGKAADVFGLAAEVLKDLVLPPVDSTSEPEFMLVPHLTHAFNQALQAGALPSSWCEGCVHPVPKVPIPASCDDFRCITVGSLLGKLFSLLLDRRLNSYLESHNLRSPAQGGFRCERGTMDQVFILRHILDRAKHQGLPVYCAFVDFRKAFDTVRHAHLWDRMRTYGIGGSFLACVQSLYAQSEASVLVDGSLTPPVRLLTGVRQGDPLSPTLFGIFIDTIDDYLRARMQPTDTFAVGGVPVFDLLYADDLVLIGASPTALQAELDVLGDFCVDWDMPVHFGKTRTVVFHPRPVDKSLVWSLCGVPVAPASRYTYLGIVFDHRKGMRPAPGRLVDSGRKALFGMIGTCHQQGLQDPSLRRHVFNALVLPVLSYGAELWCGYFPHFLDDNYFKLVPAEKVHSLFLRWHTGAPKGTHRRVLCQAGGGLPLGAHWLRRAAAFWTHLMSADPQGLAHRAFRDDITLSAGGGACWSALVLPQLLRFGALASPPPCPLWSVPASLPDTQLQECTAGFWADLAALHPRPREMPASHLSGRTLYSFAAWFRDLTSSLPVHHNVPDFAWREVLRFCVGGWFLWGATARWQSRPATPGCPCCGRPPEDEVHVVLECPVYSDLRALYGSLFTSLPPDSELAMRVLFTPSHFRPLAYFLRSVRARRGEYVADTGPAALSPSWVLHPAGVLPGVWAFPVEVGVLVACLLLAACLLAVAAFMSV